MLNKETKLNYSQPDKANASITKLANRAELSLFGEPFSTAVEETNAAIATAVKKLQNRPEYESATVTLTIQLGVEKQTTEYGGDEVDLYKPAMKYKTQLAMKEVEKTEGKLEGNYYVEYSNDGTPVLQPILTPIESMAEDKKTIGSVHAEFDAAEIE